MGDNMLIGVLRMPPSLWTGDHLDELQRYERYRQAADRIEADAEHITALETALRDCVRHMKTAGSPKAVRACEVAERLLGVDR